MKVDMHQKRLDAIKERNIRFFPQQCDICKEMFVKEPMWKTIVNNYGGYSVVFVCKHCAPHKEAVLEHLQKHYCYGIHGIDIIKPGQLTG